MVGAAIAGRRVTKSRQDDLGFQLGDARGRCLEIINFEPQQYAVPIGPQPGIADGAVMVFDLPTVQLQNQPAVALQPFIFRAAMGALAAEQSLIPHAALFDIADCDQGVVGASLHGNRHAMDRTRRDQAPS